MYQLPSFFLRRIGAGEVASTCLVIDISGTLYNWHIQIAIFVLALDIIVHASPAKKCMSCNRYVHCGRAQVILRKKHVQDMQFLSILASVNKITLAIS